MTTYGRQYEYEEILRNALQAAGDSIQPAADGLNKISHRLTVPRPLPVALVIGWLDWLYRSLTVTLPCAAEETWEALLPARKRGRHAATLIIGMAGGEARRPLAAARGGGSRRLRRSPFGRMRPAAAMFLGIFVVAAAAYVSLLVPRAMSGQAISWLDPLAPAKTAPTPIHDRGAGHGPSIQPRSLPIGASSGSTANSGVNCPNPAKSSRPASTHPSSSPSVSPSPTPSTSTTSPSPSTSTSTSPSPTDSPSAGGGSSTPTSGSTVPPSTGQGQTSRQSLIPTTGAGVRPSHKHRHHKKKAQQSCPTAFQLPVAPHGGSAVPLAAAQFTVLSRDPADSSSL